MSSDSSNKFQFPLVSPSSSSRENAEKVKKRKNIDVYVNNISDSSTFLQNEAKEQMGDIKDVWSPVQVKTCSWKRPL